MYRYTKGIIAEQKSYGFKNLVKVGVGENKFQNHPVYEGFLVFGYKLHFLKGWELFLSKKLKKFLIFCNSFSIVFYLNLSPSLLSLTSSQSATPTQPPSTPPSYIIRIIFANFFYITIMLIVCKMILVNSQFFFFYFEKNLMLLF